MILLSEFHSLKYQCPVSILGDGTSIAVGKVMKIAISHWQGRISPVFDVSSEVFLVDIKDGRANSGQIVLLGHQNPFTRAREIAALDAQMLICGAISLDLNTILTEAGIQVFGFCCGALEDILEALRTGTFGRDRYRMPGSLGPTDRSLLNER